MAAPFCSGNADMFGGNAVMEAVLSYAEAMQALTDAPSPYLEAALTSMRRSERKCDTQRHLSRRSERKRRRDLLLSFSCYAMSSFAA
eukprot:1992504-Rhodomonas_salina.2